MLRLWRFIKDKKNRDIVSWLGGGVIAVAVGIWTLVNYLFPYDDKRPTASTTVITQSGPGIASGGNTVINAPVNVGLDEKQVRQHVADAQEPLAKQLETLVAQVAREKGVEIAPLRAILVKLGEAGVSDDDIPRRLDKSADELVHLREEIARLTGQPPRLTSYAQQAQTLVDKGDLDGARTVVEKVAHVRCSADICNPDDGYVFVNPRDPADLSVRWDPGRASTVWPHVHAGDLDGTWVPDNGYVWTKSGYPGDHGVIPMASQQ